MGGTEKFSKLIKVSGRREVGPVHRMRYCVLLALNRAGPPAGMAMAREIRVWGREGWAAEGPEGTSGRDKCFASGGTFPGRLQVTSKSLRSRPHRYPGHLTVGAPRKEVIPFGDFAGLSVKC